MRHRPRPLAFRLGVAGLVIAAPLLAAAGADETAVQIDVTGLRSAKGVVRACMTSNPDHFLDCRGKADSVTVVVAAAEEVHLDFGRVAPGRYAIALLHDENNNGKADRALMMMPKEGFGFSRDAPVRFGPPSFKQAAFDVGAAPVHQTIRMRYML